MLHKMESQIACEGRMKEGIRALLCSRSAIMAFPACLPARTQKCRVITIYPIRRLTVNPSLPPSFRDPFLLLHRCHKIQARSLAFVSAIEAARRVCAPAARPYSPPHARNSAQRMKHISAESPKRSSPNASISAKMPKELSKECPLRQARLPYSQQSRRKRSEDRFCSPLPK